jgi:hypothetical protein
MPRAKARPIVAELGRPETPEEEAARRAENSRLYRQRKTVNNLIFSMLATLGVVAIIYFAVPRADETPAWQVDYVAVAETAQANVSSAIVVPSLEDTWVANAAEVRTGTDGISEWRIGFVTPSQGYIGFEQAFSADSAWVSARMEGTTPVSTVNVDGITWDVYDNGSAGNNSYALVTTLDGVTYLLRGDADTGEFAVLASAVTSALNEGTMK